ncbi:MAG: glycosyltransferase family 2 protein [Mobilitalea sp.]
MSTVSVIMATYNGEKYVGEQIDSILASSYQDFELYIYDDGSKDNTMTILLKYEREFPGKIHVKQNESNQGVAINFLHAITLTTTEYIMLCDQDDVWKPKKIELTLKKMKNIELQRNRNYPLAVFTDAVVVDKDLKVINKSFFYSAHLNPMKIDLAHLLMENKLIGCTVMVNAALRKILQSNHLPKHARFHDWWIALIASSIGKVGYVNEGTLLYRQHGGNVVGDTGFLAYLKNRITSLKMQKSALRSLYYQAEEFLAEYGDMLTEENRNIVYQFAKLQHCNFLRRRILILRYGYLKTGFIRNVGLMFLA